MRILIIYISFFIGVPISLWSQEIRKADLTLEETKVLNRNSALPFTVDLHYSRLTAGSSGQSELKTYLKEHRNAFDFSDWSGAIRYAVANYPIFNLQLGAQIGHSHYKLLNYYTHAEVDGEEVRLKQNLDEHYRFIRYGISYELNLLLSKNIKSSSGLFLHGDLTWKYDVPGQYSDNLHIPGSQFNQYASDNSSGVIANRLGNGQSWNHISLGYQFTRQLNEYFNIQLKASYGVLYGMDQPFSGSRFGCLGTALSFGKRSTREAKNKDDNYQYEKSRPKYK